MMRFIIIANDEIIGACGYCKVNANDVSEYIKRFAFCDSERAREAAQELELIDAVIKAVKVK